MGARYKTLISYSLLLVLGVILGYVLFGTSSSTRQDKPAMNADSVEGHWTCSMHPDVKNDEQGTCPICGMDLVFIGQDSQKLEDTHFELNEEAMKLANVQTMRVAQGSGGEITLNLSGLIRTNQETDAIQTTLFDGRIDRLFANTVGKKVYKGQEIGVIYSPELYIAQDKLLTSSSYKDTHPKLYSAARNTLGLWKMTDEQIDSLLSSGKPLINFPLYADVSGTITEVVASEGNYYKQGDALFKTSDLRKVWAILDAYEDQLPLIQVGQDVRLQITGIPGDGVSGKVAFVDPVLDMKKRTSSVRVVLNNPRGALRPGMFVQAAVTSKKGVEQETFSLKVPKSAVLWTGKRSLVYKKVFPDKSVFQAQEVILGNALDEQYEILEGLNPGDEIVINGTFTVDASAQLQGKTSMMGLNMHHGHDMKPIDGVQPMMETTMHILSDTFEEQEFHGLMESYMLLKDNFVTSDTKKVQDAATLLKERIKQFVKSGSVSETYASEVGNLLDKIIGTKDIQKQRKDFRTLSEHMIALSKQVDGPDHKLYVQHCDHFDDKKGGSWLSYNNEIRNPYYGDAMLKCGRILEEIN